MLNRTLTASAALLLCTAAGMVGCATDSRAADESAPMARTNANNARCPVCGMSTDSNYTAWQNGNAVNCCSQACCDKFNAGSDNDKSRWMNNAYRSSSSGGDWNADGVWEARGTNTNTTTYSDRPTTTNTTRQDNGSLNRIDPINGKSASDKFVFVDADGTRIAFSSQEAADLYMSYGPEHRAEVRNSLRQ